MRIGVRLLLVSTALALAVGATGCKGVTPPSIREESSASGARSEPSAAPVASDATKPAEPAAPAAPSSGQYAASLTSAGVAVGAELQHTADWVLGGKVWAMKVDGKPDDVTDVPKVQVVAVNANGNRSVVLEVPASQAKGASSIQGTFKMPVPPMTVRLLVVTTLGSKPDGPVLDIDLKEVPTVKALTIAGDTP